MKLAALGEVMVELAPQGADGAGTPLLAQGYAGDTYNTSVYIARSGVDVRYVTLLGDDPYSAQILATLAAEGIDTTAIEQLSGRSPGLYMIRNSADGERQFTYWRGEAPARALFADTVSRERLQAQLREVDCIYLSGITLAIMAPPAREHLLTFLAEFRRGGGRVAFDSNYRPRLWATPQDAQRAVAALLAQADIALLTLEDEQLLWGDVDADACLTRNADYPLAELVLKRGPDPVLLQSDGTVHALAVPPVTGIVDTTGAGDAFNAGYLAARLHGAVAAEAVAAGNRCAARVIRHRGAIIPAAQFAAERALAPVAASE
ncbi:sugar kinase [Microbulbifer sp. SAOS-129_SWC]|uniref:sugar kinase n=1 Tax=Microbulbifer sp. SAOS-129_SWC TaxID=3145235 RepID=UPI0032180A52